MKLAQIEQGGQTVLCARTAEGLIPLNGVGYHTMMDAIERIDELPRALEMAEAKETPLAPEDARFLPVVSRPGKIVCVGVNYGRHVKECGQSLPDAPVLFSKFATALSAHKDSVAIPRGVERLDYEAELVMVIGRRAHCVSADEAMDYVFGCTCGNDLSARDWQSRSSQWLAGKTPDGFAPVGPWITTIDAMHEIQDLEIACALNGQLRQYASTGDMIFSCAEIVSYVSSVMTLEPGDLIFTGTPDGVILGLPEEQRRWLKPGDVLEVSIENIGTLRTVIGPRE
ncbi:MAG: fumarylacetoacetate hydrolase family protein [Clostridiales bacterium]|nr:fumarylacetoacetate hydrolase family protein [Clostridiales bacterium]MDD7366589.1 fumarylacetoacetate hydrolase family protein [Clostridiales bacterium]MDY2873422.1 fumarylacetoacetate hydrolase family protein [Eubacteriales bacterium]